MKKCILVLFSLIILSGCTVTRMDKYNYEEALDKILSLNVKTFNVVGKGYKYYAPRGVIIVDESDYNDVLKRGSNTYYLYVDVVSYYYKNKLNYNKSKNVYYSRVLKNGKKSGYIEISKKNDKLFVQMVYNYAKIESYVDESKLKDAICDISYILSSLDFNDSLLKKMYEAGNLSSKEEVYKLFGDKATKGNFLEYVKEYDKYDGEENTETPEEEIIIEQTTTTATTTTTTTTSTKTGE